MFDQFKKNQEVKKAVVDKLNDEIVNKAATPGSSAKEVFELWQNKQVVKTGGITVDTMAKWAGNAIIVLAVMAFETRYVINKNAAKFIKPL